jgi:hypothetical protein
MSWHAIRSFSTADYLAYMRYWDKDRQVFRFRISSCADLTREARRQRRWYVPGWKVHLSIYPADYARSLPALRLFEDRMASTGLVYKYAASKQLYEAFEGAVKGKFATIYCRAPTEVPSVIHLINQLFTQEGVTPVSRHRIDELAGLRHELPLVGGFGFVRYGAFCYTNGILDLSDAARSPLRDNRLLPFPRFSDPCRLEHEIRAFRNVLAPDAFSGG